MLPSPTSTDNLLVFGTHEALLSLLENIELAGPADGEYLEDFLLEEEDDHGRTFIEMSKVSFLLFVQFEFLHYFGVTPNV